MKNLLSTEKHYMCSSHVPKEIFHSCFWVVGEETGLSNEYEGIKKLLGRDNPSLIAFSS